MKIGEAFLELAPKISDTFSRNATLEAGKAGLVAGKAMSESLVKTVTSDVNNKMSTMGEDAGKKWTDGFKKSADADIGLDKLIAKFMLTGSTAGARFKKSFSDENMRFEVGGFNGLLAQLGQVQAKAAVAGTALAGVAPQVAAVGVAAAPAVVSLAAMKLGMQAASKVAQAVLKVAMKDVQEAVSVAFDPEAKPEDLKEAMDKLTPSAQAVVKEISNIQKPLKDVKTLTQEGLFKPLVGELGGITEKFAPLILQQFPQISGAMGLVAKSAAQAVKESSAFDAVNAVLTSTKTAITGAGQAVPALVNGLSSGIKVLAPGVGDLGTKVGDLGAKFGEFLTRIANDGTLKRWVDTGNQTLKDFGGVLKNVLTIVFTIFKESNVQGTNLIAVLNKVTGEVAKFVTSAKGIETIQTVFTAMSKVGAELQRGLGAVLPAVAQALVAAAPAVAGLATSFGNLLVAVAPLLPFMVGLTAQLVKVLTPAIEVITKYLAQNETAMKALMVVVIAYTAAAKAQAAVLAVQAAGGIKAFIASTNLAKGATVAWTAVQWLLNAALTANPIGIVVVAIGALVAALVVAYKNSETFRKIVDAAWKGIKDAAVATWDNYLKPALEAIVVAAKKTGEGFTWLWKNAIVPAWNGIKAAIDTVWSWMKTAFAAIDTAVKAVGKVFEWLWKTIIEPVWNGIKLAVDVAVTAIKLYFGVIEVAIRALAKVFEWLRDSVIKPVWEAIKKLISDNWNAIKAIWDTIITFMKTTFKAAWDAYSALVKATWEAIKTAINTAWTFIRDSIFTPIITYLKTTFTSAWNAFRDMLKALWDAIKTMLQTAWNWIKTNVFDPWIAFINGAFKTMWTGFQTFITTLWNTLKTMFKAAYDWIKTNVFDPWVAYIKGTVQTAWTNFKTFLTTLWDAIKTALKAAWEWIRDNVFKPIADHIGGPLKNAWENGKKAIISAWEAIKNPISDTWNWVRTNVFDKVADVIKNTLPNAFSTGVGAIKTAWEKVKQAASDPVKFVVNTVINDGIIKGFNWVASKVGASTISPITLGFAGGGVLPGYTPGRDVHQFMSPTAGRLDLSGGEAIMRPEFTRTMGEGFINAANAAARAGGTSGVKGFMDGFVKTRGGAAARYANGGVLRFAGGGIIDKIKGAWEAVTDPVGTFKSAVGGLMVNMGGGPFMKDVLGKSVSKLVDSVAAWIKAKWDAAKAAMGGGNAPSGYQAMFNWVKSKVPSAQLYSGYRPGSTTLSGNTSYHAQGKAIDTNPDKRISDEIIKAFGKNITELISPWKADHVWHGQRPYDYGYAIDAQHGVYGSNAHVHWAQAKKGGIFKYDNGGWFNPGQIGVNRLSKPEAVLTPEESRGLKNLGTDELIKKLDELIDATKAVGSEVGQNIGAVGRSMINKARSV